MSVVWYPEYDFPFESTVSLLHKLMFYNSASIRETEELLGIRIAESGSNDDYQRILRHEEEIRDRLLRKIGRCDEVGKLPPSRTWKLFSVPGKSHLHGMNRVCPKCAQLGYHSSWHELTVLEKCFVHGCELTEICRHCTSSISPRISSPNLCPKSHRILGVPGSTAGHRRFCNRIESSSRTLSDWHDRAYERAIEEGVLFVTLTSETNQTPILNNFSRKDDVRNWGLSNQGLVGICAKLYGTGGIAALRGVAAEFQLQRDEYKCTNLEFDVGKWRNSYFSPSSRYLTKSKRVASVTRVLRKKVDELLHQLLDDYSDTIFVGHVPCEKAQERARNFHRSVSWPIFCKYGYARAALRKIWLEPLWRYALDIQNYGYTQEDIYELKLPTAILERMGHHLQVSACFKAPQRSGMQIANFAFWLLERLLRNELEDFHAQLFAKIESQMHSQNFEFPPLFSFKDPSDRAWLLENTSSGVRLTRVNRKRTTSFSEERATADLTHVSAVCSYYEGELNSFEEWFSSSIERTRGLYTEILDEDYRGTTEHIMRRAVGRAVIWTWE